jgi:hypothetical protein
VDYGDTQRVEAPTTRIALIDSEFARLLLAMSQRALQQMYRPGEERFVQTTRRDPMVPGGLRLEGVNLRYAAIVALGAARLGVEQQRAVLAGSTAARLAEAVARQARDTADLGSVALAAWAAAEIGEVADRQLLDRLIRVVCSDDAVPTVDFAWTLTALVAAGKYRELADLADRAAMRLRLAQGATGVFPHALPQHSLGRLRAHVGCFADQVYPIQALARHHAATGEPASLRAADRCAERIVRLQGPAGQWWWHYDVRTGEVVEGYPVYSVHQHAMAPMALFDLAEAGGADHRAAIAAGLSWLTDHPETPTSLLDEASGAIWRKVGRREPRKAVRSIRSASTALSPRLRLGLLDRVFRPTVIDYESRPYELGWLLYAWLSDGVVGARP